MKFFRDRLDNCLTNPSRTYGIQLETYKQLDNKKLALIIYFWLGTTGYGFGVAF